MSSATAARPRTGRARAADRLLRLPPPGTDYTVIRGLRAPMRDGVELLADHYHPIATSRGTVLVRGPYGRATS